jgi:hypothetical protein
MRDLKMNSIKCAVLVAGLVSVSACNGDLGYPGIFNGSAGSCASPGSDGYSLCEDFLGTDFNSEVGQSLCSNVIIGTWSGDACPTSEALGTCMVVPIATGDAQTVQYTYYPSPSSDAGAATSLTAETACGVAGGVFTAAR